QKARQGTAKVSGSKPIRTEMTPNWVGKEDNATKTEGDNGQASKDERKRLEEVLKKYKRD
ncbi:hypothetical protein U0F29_32610, partial [Bacillus thuringiensis]|nr:hypothetical protein [Bacillus thuringiensis]